MDYLKDFIVAVIITATMPALYYATGNILYSNSGYPNYGISHFLIFPLFTILVLAPWSAPPRFLTGIATAFFITYFISVSIGISSPSDMVGLEHWIFTPGAIIFSILALVFIKKMPNVTRATAFVYGLASILTGFYGSFLIFSAVT